MQNNVGLTGEVRKPNFMIFERLIKCLLSPDSYGETRILLTLEILNSSPSDIRKKVASYDSRSF